MDEQEILAVLRAHVARSQGNGTNGTAPADAPIEPSRVDLSKLDQFSAELWRLRNGVGQLNPRNAGLVNRAAQALKKFVRRSLSWYTRSLNEYHDVVNQTMEYHARAIASLQRQVLQIGGGLPETLQETLRTARRATQEQQAPYAQLFEGHSPVLDLGCGCGEFLELLNEEGVSAYGVDSDHLACQEARQKSLKVVEEDVFQHLRNVADRSLGGIFSSRMIEYLPSHLQLELVKLCSSKLKPGGLLILETVNPDSDFPFGRNSHIDPTHLRAVYPEILKSMVESNGFGPCQICALAPVQALAMAAVEMKRLSRMEEPGSTSTSPTGRLRAPAYAAIAHRL